MELNVNESDCQVRNIMRSCQNDNMFDKPVKALTIREWINQIHWKKKIHQLSPVFGALKNFEFQLLLPVQLERLNHLRNNKNSEHAAALGRACVINGHPEPLVVCDKVV